MSALPLLWSKYFGNFSLIENFFGEFTFIFIEKSQFPLQTTCYDSLRTISMPYGIATWPTPK